MDSLVLCASAGVILSGCDRPLAGSDIDIDRSLARMSAVAEFRLGHFDDPNIGFSRVTSMDVDRDGNVYVLEATVPEIRVYTPDGVLLRRIGQRGQGPGEFQGTPRFGVMGDTVWAIDSQANRITLFDRAGELISTGRAEPVPVTLPSGYAHVMPYAMRADGRFGSGVLRIAGLGGGNTTGVQPSDSLPVPFVLFDASGAVTDTIGWARRPPPRMWRPPWEDTGPQMERLQVGDRPFWVPTPPTTLPYWVYVQDGYVAVDTPLPQNADEGVFTVTRIGLAYDTIFSRRLHYRPNPYSAVQLDSIAARGARGEAGGLVPFVPASMGGPNTHENWRDAVPRLRAAMDFPAFQLPVDFTWVAQDGSIWIRRWNIDAPATRWIVLDPDGHPRGELELPNGIQIVWNRGNTMWAVEPDEMGVPWLVRYRLGDAT